MRNYTFQVEISLKNCYELWPALIQNLVFRYFITAMNRIEIIFTFKYDIRFMMLFYRNKF